jgi:hypothetical protein
LGKYHETGRASSDSMTAVMVGGCIVANRIGAGARFLSPVEDEEQSSRRATATEQGRCRILPCYS